jgi:MYXO-CTERM domain-containing protein
MALLAMGPFLAAGAGAQSLSQEYTLSAEHHSEHDLLVAGEGPLSDLVTVRLECTAPSLILLPVEVHHRIEVSHPRIPAAVDPPQKTIPADLQTCIALPTAHTYDVEVHFATPNNHPADEPITFRLHATLDDEEHLVAEWTHRVAFGGRLIADAFPTSLWAHTGQETTSDLQFINRANAPLLIELSLHETPLHGHIQHPTTVEVPYHREGPAQTTDLEITYNRTEPGTDRFVILVRATSALDGTLLEETLLRFRVEHDPLMEQQTENSPAPGALLAPLVLAGLLLRQRRRGPGHRRQD